MKAAPPAPQPSGKKGYAAIISIIIIGILMTLLGTAGTYLGIGNAQSGISYQSNQKSLQLIDSCLEDALLTYNETNTLPTSITVPTGTCSLTINSQTGTTADITLSHSLNNYPYSINVSLDRNTTVSIVSYTHTN